MLGLGGEHLLPVQARKGPPSATVALRRTGGVATETSGLDLFSAWHVYAGGSPAGAINLSGYGLRAAEAGCAC